MGALAHPVGLWAETEQSGFGAELAEEAALGLSVGGGAGLQWSGGAWCNGPGLGHLTVAAACWANATNVGFAAGQGYAYVGGLDSGAVGEEEIAEGYRGGDAEGGVRVFVVLLDAGLEADQGLLDAFAGEARRLGSGDGFSSWGG